MAEILAVGHTDPRQIKQNLPKRLWERFNSLDKFTRLFIVTGFLLVGIAPIINSMLLTTKNYAGSTARVISHISISPEEIDTRIGVKGINVSALAYGSNQQPLRDSVYYEWGTSSVDSVGVLTQIKYNVATFVPQKPGYGELHVIAVGGDKQPVLKSVQIVVRDINGNLPPKPTDMLIPTSPVTP